MAGRGQPPHPLTEMVRSDPREATELFRRVLRRTAGDAGAAAKKMNLGTRTFWRLLGDLGQRGLPAAVREECRARFRILP